MVLNLDIAPITTFGIKGKIREVQLLEKKYDSIIDINENKSKFIQTNITI